MLPRHAQPTSWLLLPHSAHICYDYGVMAACDSSPAFQHQYPGSLSDLGGTTKSQHSNFFCLGFQPVPEDERALVPVPVFKLLFSQRQRQVETPVR